MAYRPFKDIGTRTYTDLSGSGTLENVGNVYFGSQLNVTGAVTLSAVTTGSAAGSGSFIGVNGASLTVLNEPEYKYRKPINCRFTSSAADQITLTPVGIDSRGIVPVLSSSTLLNIEVTADMTMDFTDSGANGLDTGVLDTSAQGYYVYLITQANGSSPALLGSLSHNNPTMPVDYTYKSQALFKVFYNTTIEPFTNTADGWTVVRHQALSSGTSTSETYVDMSAVVPLSGTMGVQIIARNTGATSRTLKIYQSPNRQGHPGVTPLLEVFDLGKNADGEATYLYPIYLKMPVPADGKLGYLWDGSVTSGVNFVILGYKTEAYS